MSQNGLYEISVQKVFDLISNYMKDAHDVLLEVLHNEPNYKRLLKTGEKQFFDAPNESSIDVESMKSRLCVAETNFLAVQIDRDIDKIVQEKFQGEILNNLKDEVLQAILWLSSDQANNSNVICPTSAAPIESKKDNENTFLSQIKTLHNNYIQNNCEQASNETYKHTDIQAKPLLAPKPEINDCDGNLSMMSFESVSSVHTSDLSSFEDEISLSSDEELGEKKKLSLKEVQEKLEQSNSKIMEHTDINQKISKPEDQSDSYLSTIDEESSMSQKSQRKRKPNLKYFEDDVILPSKKMYTKNKFSSSQSVCSDIPRKRGRPRKYSE